MGLWHTIHRANDDSIHAISGALNFNATFEDEDDSADEKGSKAAKKVVQSDASFKTLYRDVITSAFGDELAGLRESGRGRNHFDSHVLLPLDLSCSIYQIPVPFSSLLLSSLSFAP
jgi:hypothetical protein